jgi:hypothetical protein
MRYLIVIAIAYGVIGGAVALPPPGKPLRRRSSRTRGVQGFAPRGAAACRAGTLQAAAATMGTAESVQFYCAVRRLPFRSDASFSRGR